MRIIGKSISVIVVLALLILILPVSTVSASKPSQTELYILALVEGTEFIAEETGIYKFEKRVVLSRFARRMHNQTILSGRDGKPDC